MTMKIEYKKEGDKIVRITTTETEASIPNKDGSTLILGTNIQTNIIYFLPNSIEKYLSFAKPQIEEFKKNRENILNQLKSVSFDNITLSNANIEQLNKVLTDTKANTRLKRANLESLNKLAERLIQKKNMLDQLAFLDQQIKFAEEELAAYNLCMNKK